MCNLKKIVTTHTSDTPLPVNLSPTDLHTGSSKESPPILNSPPTYTSSIVPTPSVPLILKESADVTLHNLVITPPPFTRQFRGNKGEYSFSGESNQSFFKSQFNYCPLIWIWCNRSLNNKIDRLHELSLRIVYSDKTSDFSELLEKDGSVSIH